MEWRLLLHNLQALCVHVLEQWHGLPSPDHASGTGGWVVCVGLRVVLPQPQWTCVECGLGFDADDAWTCGNCADTAQARAWFHPHCWPLRSGDTCAHCGVTMVT